MMGSKMEAQPAQKTRKPPNLWALASVTYGAVIAVTILSVLVYYYIVPKRVESQLTDATRSMAVGSVWIAVYPGATIEGTASEKRDSGTESALNFESKDQPDRVLSFYQAALKKGVFRFDTVTKNDGGGTVRSMAHAGKTTVVVTIRPTAEGSRGEIRTVDKDSPK
jgi:hypothetical protein